MKHFRIWWQKPRVYSEQEPERRVTFLQMIAIGAMAVFVHHAIWPGFAGFTISYILFQLIITYLWWRTGVHDPDHRPLSVPYTITYLAATLVLVASLFVEAPFRYYLWGLNLLMTLSLPIILQVLSLRNIKMRMQFDRSATAPGAVVPGETLPGINHERN